MSSHINDVLRNETIYYRKSHLLKNINNQQNKLFKRELIQDSLLIKKSDLSSNREITNKQFVKLPSNQKLYTFIKSEPHNSKQSYEQKNKTQSTADLFYSFFTFNKYNPNILLKSKNSKPFSFRKSFYKKQL
ncbi:unnamed protein product [Paramecium primaurelia]|uniref:Uncharacterized protein n=1 Tax=Paramecium primaurelia TaxID=5886 RepID=A0A8S1JX15_PARPR|nr:unnamed protein product [Paramecium primaurelia]